MLIKENRPLVCCDGATMTCCSKGSLSLDEANPYQPGV